VSRRYAHTRQDIFHRADAGDLRIAPAFAPHLRVAERERLNAEMTLARRAAL
jgi:hypothetical protein